MSQLTREAVFPGAAREFRTGMQRLFNLHRGKWVSSEGENFVFREFLLPEMWSDERRSTWVVYPDIPIVNGKRGGHRGDAAVEAYGEGQGVATVVHFLDGYGPPTLIGLPPREMPPLGTAFEEFAEWVVRGLWPGEASGGEASGGRQPGRPALSHEELIYRLAKAQEAEEIREREPDKVWKEIAVQIGWDHGARGPGLSLLGDARRRLRELAADDPLLREVTEWRARGAKGP